DVAGTGRWLVANFVHELMDEVPAESALDAAVPIRVEIGRRGLGRVEERCRIDETYGHLGPVDRELEPDGAGRVGVGVLHDVGESLLDGETHGERGLGGDARALAGGVDVPHDLRQILDTGRLEARAFPHGREPAHGWRPLSSVSIFPSNRCRSTGLVSKSSHPAASARSRSAVIACAVSAITGIERVRSSAF